MARRGKSEHVQQHDHGGRQAGDDDVPGGRLCHPVAPVRRVLGMSGHAGARFLTSVSRVPERTARQPIAAAAFLSR